MVASDQHGPAYPGDLIITRQGVMYQTMKFGVPGMIGQQTDRADDMVGTSNPETICMVVASCRGIGTWKYVVASDQIGWIPWSACELVQASLPTG